MHTIRIESQPNEERELSQNLNNSSFSIIDTREEREFEGSTPYGENRGGHIPKAHFALVG